MWPVAFRLDGRERYLLWIAREAGDDEVMADGDRVRVFDTLEELHRYAARHGIALEETDADGLIDIDAAEQWCRTRSAPDAELLLTVWNLCGDVARGTRRRFDDRGEDRDRVYDVVFYGNNLPSMTPPGESFVPDSRRPRGPAKGHPLRSRDGSIRGCIAGGMGHLGFGHLGRFRSTF